MAAALLSLLAAVLFDLAFKTNGPLRIGLLLVGVILLYCAFLAVLKRFGELG